MGEFVEKVKTDAVDFVVYVEAGLLDDGDRSRLGE